MKSEMRLELWPELGSRASAWIERPFVTKLQVCYRKVLVSLALVLPALVPGMLLGAQSSSEAHPAQRAKARYIHPSIDDQVEVLTKYLELSDQQRSALKNTLEQRQEEILAMRRTPSNTNANPSDRFRMIEDETVERIRALLTEEQLKKYDPIGARSTIPAQQQQSVEDLLTASKPRQ